MFPEGSGAGDDAVIDWWVVEHAAQVRGGEGVRAPATCSCVQVKGMLPGGLDVVGVYICCQVLQTSLARLAKVLASIVAGREFKGHQPHPHMSLLHYCPVKKK